MINGDDPTESSHLLPLKMLLNAMDADIASLYPAQGAGAVSTRFSMVLVRLKYRGPLTIRDLAAQVGVTHSAMSQTVAAMKKEGLIESSPGTDARTRVVQLTDAGLALVPFLEAEWRATEAAWAELEQEIPYALAQVVEDLNSALARRTFRDRLLGHLDSRFHS